MLIDGKFQTDFLILTIAYHVVLSQLERQLRPLPTLHYLSAPIRSQQRPYLETATTTLESVVHFLRRPSRATYSSNCCLQSCLASFRQRSRRLYCSLIFVLIGVHWPSCFHSPGRQLCCWQGQRLHHYHCYSLPPLR